MRWQAAAGIRKRVAAAVWVKVRVSEVKDVGSTGRVSTHQVNPGRVAINI
jgi:hypothetical protein